MDLYESIYTQYTLKIWKKTGGGSYRFEGSQHLDKVEIYENELIIFSHKKINNLKHNKSIIDKWINEQTQNIFTKR